MHYIVRNCIVFAIIFLLICHKVEKSFPQMLKPIARMKTNFPIKLKSLTKNALLNRPDLGTALKRMDFWNFILFVQSNVSLEFQTEGKDTAWIKL